ncbi:hypothetical protein fh0823_13750 [Francisella halioticida]|uniref:Transposase n=1 Tax=Francisella halioticida TaxID=549298 RepID=A0ABM6M0J3_9GAMM|nr:hypothetical protein CDV26_08215 [Francisella halioticida]BCD91236.1 hypothetical protein fh0823_13750 [Francisella halioticida]
MFAIYWKVKSIYTHTKKYWNGLFPSLAGHAAFNKRINKLESVFVTLIEPYQKKCLQIFMM